MLLHPPGEVRRNDQGGLIVPVANALDGLLLISEGIEYDGSRPGRHRPQVFQQPPAGRTIFTANHRQGKPGQLALEGMAKDQQIEDRHHHAHRDHQRVAPKLLQIPVYHRKHPHRHPLLRQMISRFGVSLKSESRVGQIRE